MTKPASSQLLLMPAIDSRSLLPLAPFVTSQIRRAPIIG
jgi:hypothetical protein